MKRRPYISKVYSRPWADDQGNTTPGIALRQGRYMVAHLTGAEAIELANRLVDLTEELQQITR